MFRKDRYKTIGIDHALPLELQAFLWNLIDHDIEMNKEMDYLQVFELKKTKKGYQQILHTQEEPERSREYILTSNLEEIVATKVYIIDSGDYSTMMLAEEY